MKKLMVMTKWDKPSRVLARNGFPVEYVRAYPIVGVLASSRNTLLVRIMMDGGERDVELPKSQVVERRNASFRDIYISPRVAEKIGL